MTKKVQSGAKPTIEKIMALLPKLSHEDFNGLAILLSVRILTDTWDKQTKKAVPRNAEEVLFDCINILNSLEESEQKFYYKLIKKAVSNRR